MIACLHHHIKGGNERFSAPTPKEPEKDLMNQSRPGIERDFLFLLLSWISPKQLLFYDEVGGNYCGSGRKERKSLGNGRPFFGNDGPSAIFTQSIYYRPRRTLQGSRRGWMAEKKKATDRRIRVEWILPMFVSKQTITGLYFSHGRKRQL